MKLRKIRADQIFDGRRIWKEHVLVADSEGIILDLLPLEGNSSDLEEYEGILLPGLVNCHCHLELSHMKGIIPEGTGLVDFVLAVVKQRHLPAETIADAIEAAEEEMIRNGIVAVGDICNNTATIPQKKKKRIAYYNFIEVTGWLPAVAEARFLRSRDIYEEYLNLRDGSFAPGAAMVPHAPYSVSDPLWKLIHPFFESRVITMHNQESAEENAFFRNGTGEFNRLYRELNIDNSHHKPTGRSSLQSVYPLLSSASHIILVHNSFISEDDLRFLLSQMKKSFSPALFFCLCISANQYIERSLPPIELMRLHNLMMVLGTDSLASNQTLDILREVRSIRKFFPQIPLEEILKWATLNGALALKMDKKLGSFEKGKQPGCILADHNLNLKERLF